MVGLFYKNIKMTKIHHSRQHDQPLLLSNVWKNLELCPTAPMYILHIFHILILVFRYTCVIYILHKCFLCSFFVYVHTGWFIYFFLAKDVLDQSQVSESDQIGTFKMNQN